MSNTIRLPQLAWHGAKQLKLNIPRGWNVETCNMAGYNRKAMTPAEIKKAVTSNLIGLPPLREVALGKKEVAIIFDDMSRVTRVAQIVPFVLAELAAAGIADNRIRFVPALGCHAAMDRFDFVNKLGESVVSRFPVYNHNAFGNCTYVGTTRAGTRVNVNAEVIRCDLKIAIGSIVAHIFSGFGGGAKIVMPGITSIETTEAFHRYGMKVKQEHPETPIGIGIYEGNPLRTDMEEAAELAGIDIKIDCILNLWGETVAIYAGALKQAYSEGVLDAKDHYLTPRARDKDIVIANAYCKVNEAEGGLVTAMPSVSSKGGDLVLIGNAPEGHVTHFLMGSFGEGIGGNLRLQLKIPANINNIIIYNEYPDFTIRDYIDPREKAVLLSKWDDVVGLLRKNHGDNASVAVYPNAEIQYCA